MMGNKTLLAIWAYFILFLYFIGLITVRSLFLTCWQSATVCLFVVYSQYNIIVLIQPFTEHAVSLLFSLFSLYESEDVLNKIWLHVIITWWTPYSAAIDQKLQPVSLCSRERLPWFFSQCWSLKPQSDQWRLLAALPRGKKNRSWHIKVSFCFLQMEKELSETFSSVSVCLRGLLFIIY